MKRGVYDLYRPKKTINDMRETSSYYHAADVSVSPFTRIGHLIEPDEPAGAPPVGPISPTRIQTLKHPIFPAGFMLKRPTQASTSERSHSGSAFITTALGQGQRLYSAVRHALAAAGVSIAAAAVAFRQTFHIPSLLHHRYVTGKGWVADPPSLTGVARFALPGVVAIILVALLVVPASPPSQLLPHRPGSHAGSTPASGGNAALHTQSSSKTSSQSGSQNSSTGSPGTASTTRGSNTIALPGSYTSPTYPLSGQSSGSTLPVGNGRGSGPSGSGSGSGQSSGGIPGVTQPVTATIPGTNVGTGGKTVVGTSPTSVTLN